jgi:hypothetical protein
MLGSAAALIHSRRSLGRRLIARALALTEGLCWDSLNRGDTAAFARQAAVCAELHDFGACAGLLKEAWASLSSVLR